MIEKEGANNFNFIMQQINDCVIKVLLSVNQLINENMRECPKQSKCPFEIYGFDILIDKEFKPWVLEVNCLPSLSSSSPFDKRVKTMLVCDVLTLVGIKAYDKQKEAAIASQKQT